MCSPCRVRTSRRRMHRGVHKSLVAGSFHHGVRVRIGAASRGSLLPCSGPSARAPARYVLERAETIGVGGHRDRWDPLRDFSVGFLPEVHRARTRCSDFGSSECGHLPSTRGPASPSREANDPRSDVSANPRRSARCFFDKYRVDYAVLARSGRDPRQSDLRLDRRSARDYVPRHEVRVRGVRLDRDDLDLLRRGRPTVEDVRELGAQHADLTVRPFGPVEFEALRADESVLLFAPDFPAPLLA